MKGNSILAGIAVIFAAGCAGTPTEDAGDRAAAASDSDCIRTSLIRDWEALDDRNLIVYESGERPYHVELAQTCFGLDSETMIGVTPRPLRHLTQLAFIRS